jgi:hypothetical protein
VLAHFAGALKRSYRQDRLAIVAVLQGLLRADLLRLEHPRALAVALSAMIETWPFAAARARHRRRLHEHAHVRPPDGSRAALRARLRSAVASCGEAVAPPPLLLWPDHGKRPAMRNRCDNLLLLALGLSGPWAHS